MSYEIGIGFILGSILVASAMLLTKTEKWLRILFLTMFMGTLLVSIVVMQNFVTLNNGSANMTTIINTLLSVAIWSTVLIYLIMLVMFLYDVLYEMAMNKKRGKESARG